MDAETKKEIDALKREIADLKSWKVQRISQQLSYPLDKASFDILSQFVPVWNNRVAEAPPEYPGAICKLGSKKLAFLVVDPSIYE